MSKEIDELLPKWKRQIYDFSKEYQGLIIACSGGLDSTALLHIFCENLKSQNFLEVRVVHVNYALRGIESDGDQSFVEALAGKLGIVCDSFKVDHRSVPASGIQEWARDIRRAKFMEYAKAGYLILTAHHKDDVAETTLLRMARGTSAGHLAGIMRLRPPFWRPFVEVGKAALNAYLTRQNCPHRHDASNDKIDYKRNFVRHHILPALESVHVGSTEKIVHLAAETADLADFCKAALHKMLAAEEYQPKVMTLQSLKPGVLYTCLELMVEQALKQDQATSLSRELLSQIERRLFASSQKEWSIVLPKRLLFKVSYGIASVCVGDPSQKRVRAKQHEKALRMNICAAVLSPGAQLNVVTQLAKESKTTSL